MLSSIFPNLFFVKSSDATGSKNTPPSPKLKNSLVGQFSGPDFVRRLLSRSAIKHGSAVQTGRYITLPEDTTPQTS